MDDNDSYVDEAEEMPASPLTKVRAKTTGTPKRKASPLFQTLSKRGKAALLSAQKKPVNFADMLLTTFKEPAFISGAAPLIHAMLAPLMQSTVDAAINSTIKELKTSLIDKLLESNAKLQDTVSAQFNTMKQMQGLLDEQSRDLKAKAETIKSLESRLDSLTVKVESVQQSNNDLEQYSRRNSIRMTNVKFDQKASETDLTSQVTSFLNKTPAWRSTPVSWRHRTMPSRWQSD